MTYKFHNYTATYAENVVVLLGQTQHLVHFLNQLNPILNLLNLMNLHTIVENSSHDGEANFELDSRPELMCIGNSFELNEKVDLFSSICPLQCKKEWLDCEGFIRYQKQQPKRYYTLIIDMIRLKTDLTTRRKQKSLISRIG